MSDAPTLTRFVAEPDATAERIREFCRDRPDLLADQYANPETVENPLPALCYPVAEAYFHANGAYDGPLDVYCLSWSDVDPDYEGTHWFLGDGDLVIDLTGPANPGDIPWNMGTRRGFMSRAPSNRTQEILDALDIESPELVAEP